MTVDNKVWKKMSVEIRKRTGFERPLRGRHEFSDQLDVKSEEKECTLTLKLNAWEDGDVTSWAGEINSLLDKMNLKCLGDIY